MAPNSRHILLLRSSVNSRDLTVMCHDPAIPCNHQLNLGPHQLGCWNQNSVVMPAGRKQAAWFNENV
ncbi:hypothetical protein BHE74_00010145 [Ensete ventricosum]|nr:hypothetical protein BHE74_00010145 [Ensete ventricosum]